MTGLWGVEPEPRSEAFAAPPREPRGAPLRRLAVAALAIVALAGRGEAQEEASLFVAGGERRGGVERVAVERHGGFAAVRADVLETLGWSVIQEGEGLRARFEEGPELSLRLGTPFVWWDGELLQLVEGPYRFSGSIYVPIQLLTDLLPERMGQRYAWEPERRTVRVQGAVDRRGDPPGSQVRVGGDEGETPRRRASRGGAGAERAGPAAGAGAAEGGEEAEIRIVVIDPGHGGEDSGARGAGGLLEKDVALGVARALARELEEDPGIEVRLVRSDDRYVPIWARGDSATAWRGERPGIFLSLHANAAARSRSVRGFETYFLSPARTDHERRVVALENAPLHREEGSEEEARAFGPDPDLGFILNDLRNHDYVHWSSRLAELVQSELAGSHPGPDRGVKQGPFAVITNALMPSVLVELGFITNPAEERLLGRRDFQAEAARSLARAVRAFFERYPPRAGAADR